FTSVSLVKELMEKTTTSKGLSVTVEINENVYQTKRQTSEDFKEEMPIIFDDYLPQWNYRAIPRG
ncbi:ISAzo13 family transposase, partial [Deltaproteobacteria bacterium TL4]